jgi:hypothetical protein
MHKIDVALDDKNTAKMRYEIVQRLKQATGWIQEGSTEVAKDEIESIIPFLKELISYEEDLEDPEETGEDK